MKNFLKPFLAMFFIGTMSFSAMAINEPSTKDLHAEIAALLDDIQLPEGNDYQAIVDFVINDENQIVVVDVETTDEFVDTLIKSRLNYKTIETTTEANKMKQVKITLKQPE